MVYLLFAILSSALISVFMRSSEQRITHNIGMLAVNYLVCLILSAFYTNTHQFFPQTQGLIVSLILGIVSGILYLAAFVLMQWNVSHNGVVLSATFMKLGVLVPTAMSVLVFREVPTAFQVLGFFGALAAILLINTGAACTIQNRGALLLLLLGGGLTDAMSKIYEELGPSSASNQFLFWTFLTALFLCLCLILIKRQSVRLPDILFGLLIGIPNYYSTRFLLLALNSVPAVVAYPTYSVSTIVCATAAGVLLFREALDRRRICALMLILISLVFLNL